MHPRVYLYSGDLYGCVVGDVQHNLAIEIFVINLGTKFDTIFILKECQDQLA